MTRRRRPPSFLVRWDRGAAHEPAFHGEARSLTLRDGRRVTLALEGHVHDLAPGEDAFTRVAETYAEHGRGFPGHLRGTFSLALWDPGEERLWVVRDATGTVPCLWHQQGSCARFSPELDPLLDDIAPRPGLDPLVMAEYLAGHLTRAQWRQTFYRGVERLPAGHFLEVSAGDWRERRYFDPLPPGFRWAGSDEREELIPSLERAVVRCLDAGADCLALSGGYDSTAIAAAAAAHRGHRPPLHAICVQFEWTEVDEAARQRHTAGVFDMPMTSRSSTEALPGGVVGAALGYSKLSPSPVLSLWQGIYAALFATASGRGLGRLLQGTGGDEMFDVGQSYVEDCLQRGDLGQLAHYLRTVLRASPDGHLAVTRYLLWHGGLRPLGGRLLSAVSVSAAERLRVRDHPLWPRDPATRAQLRERRRARMPRGAEGPYADSLRQLVASPLVAIEQDQSFALMRHHGFESMLPFFDRDLYALALRQDPTTLIAGGLSKAPLRAYVSERVPGFPLDTQKVDFTAFARQLLRDPLRERWRRLGGAQALGALGAADPEAADAAMERFLGGHLRQTMRAWLLLSAEEWVRARGE